MTEIQSNKNLILLTLKIRFKINLLLILLCDSIFELKSVRRIIKAHEA